MPLDGTMLAAVAKELSVLTGGRVDKVTQPEPDELIISVRAGGVNHKLLLTANANAPRISFTKQAKISPLTAPMFCMVLRKHLSSGRILSICQPDFERIIEIQIEAMDEMGDKSAKKLIIEIMGKHSNILLVDAHNRVVDAIKHISPAVSSVRTVLPGSVYVRPPNGGKQNPLETNLSNFAENISRENLKIQQAIYTSYNGISPVLANETCFNAGISPETPAFEISPQNTEKLFNAFTQILNPYVIESMPSASAAEGFLYWDKAGKAVDISALPLMVYSHLRAESFESPSAMLESFYTKRDKVYRVKQKTVDLRKLITIHLERARKKSFGFEKTMDEIQSRDELRIKGELLTAYLYMIKSGEKSFTAENFYDENKPISITLDPALSPSENAQKYFKKYNKQKRTFVALQEQIKKNNEELTYLESVLSAMDTITDEADISEIRSELAELGFVKRRTSAKNKKATVAAKPLKFITKDNFEIYVGKNNTQNDYLTLRFARGDDIWMHTKDIPGSHVIIVTGGREPSEEAILEGANLAAFHSRAKTGSNIPVDYVTRKHVRKPAGAKPGFVIYDYHKTVYVTPKEVTATNNN